MQLSKLGQRIELVLDRLPVLEKLWAVSYAFHPEGSPEAREFVKERILRILRGEVSQVVKGLRPMVTQRKLKGQRRATVLAVAALLLPKPRPNAIRLLSP